MLAERLPCTTEDYAELVPDLMFEVKSKTDSLTKLRQKIQEFLELGTKLGVLVDPRTCTMEAHCLDADKIVLKDGDVLQVPELLPGLELPVVEVWAPEFD
ncbi:Uma2 family endonuclease [Dapis sp. BLCC M126]|uniref:Uma2 family endonuclease n=1 Tax=Dapis sp. BLCC M126 TaxID=3400189 RepID=UPI003CFA8270